ncbi:hypothetical protein U1Q18_027896 [Sarracenia purpurea var. burkii]
MRDYRLRRGVQGRTYGHGFGVKYFEGEDGVLGFPKDRDDLSVSVDEDGKEEAEVILSGERSKWEDLRRDFSTLTRLEEIRVHCEAQMDLLPTISIIGHHKFLVNVLASRIKRNAPLPQEFYLRGGV